ncbi:MAG TPA: helix-turn-helix transcriptional regulator [Pyrinomonadaceae bacterium]
MFPQKNSIVAPVESKTYPLGEKPEQPSNGHAHALVALSHSTLEHRLYSAMLPNSDENAVRDFTVRRLMDLTGIRSLSTIRRGLEGLLAKFSIERNEKRNGGEARAPGASYSALPPEQIITRRRELGIGNYESTLEKDGHHAFERAIARVAQNTYLSRREAQVALCCVEGLTNAEIGHRLDVTEQTVKFHLRHIFVKFGVKRRAELISRLLM